nr:unnamed protein product [Digitaria exilis]
MADRALGGTERGTVQARGGGTHKAEVVHRRQPVRDAVAHGRRHGGARRGYTSGDGAGLRGRAPARRPQPVRQNAFEEVDHATGGAPADGIDRIGALPDEVLHHVLSFLRAQDAVRTCVLAQRWRHLWRFATGLRIGCGEDDCTVASVPELREFVDNLLLLRGLVPLVKCEFSFDEYGNEDVHRLNLWIKHAILCQVQGRKHDVEMKGRYISLQKSAEISQHLEIEVKCKEVDRIVVKVLKFFGTFGIFFFAVNS